MTWLTRSARALGRSACGCGRHNVRQLDQNADGKLDLADAHAVKDKLLPIVTAGLPGAGAFTAGFLVGWKI